MILDKFKIGQKVRVVSLTKKEGSLPLNVGACGTVVDVGLYYFVEFPFSLPPHGSVLDGKFLANEDQIEFTGASVTEAIDAYQQACTDFEAAQLAVEKAKAAVQDARLNLRDALDGEA